MTSANPIASNLDDINAKYLTIETSDAAKSGEDLDGLRILPHDDLVTLAWEALTTLKRLGKLGYSYPIAMVEQHLGFPSAVRCKWVIAQADVDGSFNKMEKCIASAVPGEEGPLLFDKWSDADRNLRSRPHILNTHRVYPVVIIAGCEPRTTIPVEEL